MNANTPRGCRTLSAASTGSFRPKIALPLCVETSVMQLPPRHAVAWDLSSPDKRSIPEELFLASLATRTWKGDRNLLTTSCPILRQEYHRQMSVTTAWAPAPRPSP